MKIPPRTPAAAIAWSKNQLKIRAARNVLYIYEPNFVTAPRELALFQDLSVARRPQMMAEHGGRYFSVTSGRLLELAGVVYVEWRADSQRNPAQHYNAECDKFCEVCAQLRRARKERRDARAEV